MEIDLIKNSEYLKISMSLQWNRLTGWLWEKNVWFEKNLLADSMVGSDVIRCMLFWLNPIWLSHRINPLIVIFQKVERVITSTVKL